MGVMQFVAPILRANVADYSSADFYRVLTPIGVVISIVLTLLAVIGIWEKDQPKYFGVGGEKQEKVKVSEYSRHQEQQADAASDDRRSRMQTCAFLSRQIQRFCVCFMVV